MNLMATWDSTEGYSERGIRGWQAVDGAMAQLALRGERADVLARFPAARPQRPAYQLASGPIPHELWDRAKGPVDDDVTCASAVPRLAKPSASPRRALQVRTFATPKFPLPKSLMGS
jgi:hypothetical protein